MLEMRFPISLSPPLSGIAFIKIDAKRRSGAFVSSDLCKNVFPSVSPAFHTACALSAPSGHLPLEGKAGDTRIPSSKKTARPPCEPIRSPVSSSRAQPRDLSCTAAICTHATSLKQHLGASFFAFPSPTFYRSVKRIPPLSGIALYKNRREASHLGLQRRFLDFARNDDTTKTPRLSTRRSCYFKTYFTTSYDSFSFGAPKARDGLSFSASSSFSRPSRPSVRSS